MANRIVRLETTDLRFPTSERLEGSDAKNRDPDYSAAYIELEARDGLTGYSLIFTIGRGNDICCYTVEAMRHLIVGKDLNEIVANIGEFYNEMRADSQLQWLGPEKGVIHMAMGGIVNAVWDMWARREQKPLWRLLSDMPSNQFVDCLDYRHVTDILTREEALAIVTANAANKATRIRSLEKSGFPAYTTSAGWLGYGDDKLKRLCMRAVKDGFRHIKIKVGKDIDEDVRRCRLIRQILGDDIVLMIDANQTWEVDQAIAWMRELRQFDPWFVEEPTHPDDVLGHKKIRDALDGIRVATGEHCQNRIGFKQLIAGDAVDIVQVDACRLAGLNEILTVYMLAAKFGKLVCPHAGGVGLCEYVQHLAMIDYVQISAEIGERVIEYVDHLHEHFETPCQVVDGSYLAPTQPGFSVKILPSSKKAFCYRSGQEWRFRKPDRKKQSGGNL